MELLYKAGELANSEIDTPIEMEVTLDHFVSNIGYVRQISRVKILIQRGLSFQWSTGNISLRGLTDKSWV